MSMSELGGRIKNTVGIVGLGAIITVALWTFIVFELSIGQNQLSVGQ